MPGLAGQSPNYRGMKIVTGGSEAAMSAHRAIVRCRARQRPRPFPRARGATGGAATSRRAGFGRASRAQAGVTSARSK
ncbi:hypothetical protein DP61_5643 [Burkholderia pseudomallei]|nr:hypothetical protein DP61_5643 [Burkholderia pseudomallei]